MGAGAGGADVLAAGQAVEEDVILFVGTGTGQGPADQGGREAGGGQVLDLIRVLRRGPGRARKSPDSVAADKAYSNGPCREYLRQRGFDEERYKKRNLSNERSTGSSNTEPSRPDTTSAVTSSSAPQQRHERPDKSACRPSGPTRYPKALDLKCR